MVEAFLMLLAGGVLLAAAVSDPTQVTLNWLRLAGIIALSVAGLSLYFWLTRENAVETPVVFRSVHRGLVIATFTCIVGQLAFVQVARRRTQRACAFAGFVVAVFAGANLIHDVMIVRGSAVNFQPKTLSLTLQTLT